MNFTQLLKEKKNNYEKEGSYFTRIAGDTTSFRYPHLNVVSDNFEYDSAIKTFFLKQNIEDTIRQISINEITLYELMNAKAKRLHLYDFFGFHPSSEEKYEAFTSVCEGYQRNQANGSWNVPYEIQKVTIGELPIQSEFEYLKNFIRKSQGCEVYFCKFKNRRKMFQFGSTLKGTNVVFVDDSKANFCQELFHAIWHLEEGIPGVNDDNMNIKETWGNADALYLKQLLDGRLSRRVRNNNSPHDIKFLDYVFLRAYIGQAFLSEDETAKSHNVFALIEPTMKLLVDALGKDNQERNRLLINGICYDKTEPIKLAFNAKYGNGSYEKVFYEFNLFKRMEVIRQIAINQSSLVPYEVILAIMFNDNHLLPTNMDNDIIKTIWLNPSMQKKETILNLIEGKEDET